MDVKALSTDDLVALKESVSKELVKRVRKLAESAGIALKEPRKSRAGHIVDTKENNEGETSA